MVRFNVGDNVRVSREVPWTSLRGVRGVVEYVFSEESLTSTIYAVRLVTGPKKGKRENFKEVHLELYRGGKSLELRAKYKAAPKRDMVLIGEWNASHSGAGCFYAPRDRRSQVERTFLALEENDASKEAFDSVVRAGGVFIRD